MNIAHIREKDSKLQTVEEHCLAVSEKTAGFASQLGAENMGKLLGLLHDMGKMSGRFKDYISGVSHEARGSIDHSYAGAKYITELSGGDSSLRETSRFIGRIIAAHHGLYDIYNENGEDCFGARLSKRDEYDEIKNNFEHFRSASDVRKLLVKADGEYRHITNMIDSISDGNEKAFAFYLGLYERIMLSMLADADRIDTADFETGKSTELIIGRDELDGLWSSMCEKINDKLRGFEKNTDSISKQRRSISDRCYEYASEKRGICRLVVPTGGGKTLSSLRFAARYCKNYGMNKIIYVAPFMSILEQNSDEVRSIAGDKYFLEHYSDFFSGIENSDEANEYKLRTEKWDMPVIATTMVQFLNSLFLGKMSSVRRMHRLCGSVIIIDEVQSVPIKCINMFDLAMNFLSRICGCTVVLCSATQPVFDKAPFPVILDNSPDMTGDHTADFEVFRRTEVIPTFGGYGYSFEETADFCAQKLDEHGNLLVIVNTKAAAAEIFTAMKNMPLTDDTELIYLSTNMCPEHRRNTISEMKNSLRQNKKIVCISTQLIEAGVDISFRCVVRSLAGLDSVAQAAGRCNRHGEAGMVCPVYIIDIKDEIRGGLYEIKTARQISRRMISNGYIDGALSVKTISQYYELLFRDRENEMSYSISSPDTTLVDLLSLNQKWHNPRLGTGYKKENKYCAQAFKTAGRRFEVIDSETEGVIVHYNDEADKIIDELSSKGQSDNMTELLRRAQKYTVDIYRGAGIKLDSKGAIYRTACGVLVLEKEFYDSSLGITYEGSQMETLVF